MSNPQGIALFGGTFDPVHQGHLQPLRELLTQFGWQRVELLPTYQPPHRAQPQADIAHRWQMLKLATARDDQLQPNDWEIAQGQPSRTIHTLQHFQQPGLTLFFIIGMDSLLSLTSWLNYEQLFAYTNFVVLPRPGYDLQQASPALHQEISARLEPDPMACYGHTGRIHLARTTPLAISATELRAQLAEGTQPAALHSEVYHYIRQHQLYQSMSV